jgi:hypothetical protein
MAKYVKTESESTTVNANPNMILWDKVCETNPEITKRVATRGGFTSIDAQTQVKRATELFGQYGSKWGMRDLSYQMIYDNGTPVGLSLVTMFYYPIQVSSSNGSGRSSGGGEGKFPISSDMAYNPKDDCYKKLATDALTKALSRLGFNSDVFEGKFDDSKYVAKMKKKYKADTKPDVKEYTPNAKAKTLLKKIAEKYEATIEGCKIDMDKLTAAVFNKYGKYPSKASAVDTIVNAIDITDVTVLAEKATA